MGGSYRWRVALSILVTVLAMSVSTSYTSAEEIIYFNFTSPGTNQTSFIMPSGGTILSLNMSIIAVPTLNLTDSDENTSIGTSAVSRSRGANNGTHIWVLNSAGDDFRAYELGDTSATSHDTKEWGSAGMPFGYNYGLYIDEDNTYWVATERYSVNAIGRYYANDTLISNFSIANDKSMGVAVVDDWVFIIDSDEVLWRYTKDGTLVENRSMTEVGNAVDICHVGTTLIIADYTNDVLHFYQNYGENYLGYLGGLDPETYNNDIFGCTVLDNHLYIVDSNSPGSEHIQAYRYTFWRWPGDVSIDIDSDGTGDVTKPLNWTNNILGNFIMDESFFNTKAETCDSDDDGFCTIYFNVTVDNANGISVLDVEMTHEYILNLSFDEEVNATMIHSEGGYTINLTEIYEYMSDVAIGKISVTFNDDYQLIEFYNDNETEFTDLVHVTDTPDKVQDFTVWDRFQPLEDVNIKIYELTGTDVFSLIWASFTENQGKGSANLVSGKEYRFIVNDMEGYNDFTEDRYIVPGADDVLNFVLIEEEETLGHITPYTNCPSTAIANESCTFYVSSTQVESSIVFQWILNESGVLQTSVYSNVDSASMPVTLTPSTWRYDVNVSVEGVLVGSWSVEYESIADRDVTILTADEFEVDEGSMLLFTILIMIVAASMGGFSNWLWKGSGIYVYGVVLAIFSGVLGNFYMAGICIGVVVIANVMGRLI